MNRIMPLVFILAFAFYAYSIHISNNNFWFSLQANDLGVDLGSDTTLCQAGSRVDFQPLASDPNLFMTRWSPGAAVDDSTSLNTFGVFDRSTTLGLSVFTISDVELIANGDFEQGNTLFRSDYTIGTSTSQIGPLALENTYAVTNDPQSWHRSFEDCPDHTGMGNRNMMIANGSGQSNNVWCQDSIVVEPNADYVFSAWLVSMESVNPARMQFSINDEIFGDVLEANSQTCVWEQFFASWNSGDTSLAKICIVNINDNVSGNDFALDDISFRPLCVARDTIQVDVAELSAAWNGLMEICADEAPIALHTLLAPNTTLNGVWTLDGLALDTLNPAEITPGAHELIYRVEQAQCSEEQARTINILEVLSAGVALPPQQLCFPGDEVVQLAELLEGEDPGGVWTEISIIPSSGGAFNVTDGSFDISGQTPGMYTFLYTQTAPVGCNSSEAEVNIQLSPAPIADAGPDMEFDCVIDMLTIGGSGSDVGSEFTYQWTALNGSPINSPNEAMTEITRADTYTLRVENTQTGCFAEDEVVITATQSRPQLTASTVNISCPGAEDGQILIESIVDGQAPYTLTLNGDVVDAQQPLTGLSPGDYTLIAEDANGCKDTRQFNLAEPPTPNLSISREILAGDTTLLQLDTDLPTNDIASVDWSPTACPNCFSLAVKPSSTTEYTAALIDQNGCVFTVNATVEAASPIEQGILFIPNAFSPNDDGNNDYFTIFSAKGQAANIKMLHILDRWGNLVFSKQNFPPDEPEAGWDGFFKGQTLNTGVFIYVAEVELTNGNTVTVQGDVALVY